MESLLLKGKLMRLGEKLIIVEKRTHGFCPGCVQLQTELDECFELCENITDECVDLRRALEELA